MIEHHPTHYTEAQAAAMLGVSDRALRRWRTRGAVPYSRTPGGRIFYTFAQLTQIGASMVVEATVPLRPHVATDGQTRPHLSGDMSLAAE